MQSLAHKIHPFNERKVIHTTKGNRHGPITRLVSPGDLGEFIKPFVFLDSFNLDTSGNNVFGWHPHSGIVTVTTIFEGDINYEDSTGKAGVLSAGTVEWMQAGSGVWHTTNPAAKAGAHLRGYQLWLTLPEALENTAPESIYLAPEEIPAVGSVRVIIGHYQGVTSPLPQISPITYLHVRLVDGEVWTFDPPSDHDVLWIAIDEGTVSVSDEPLSNEIAVFDLGSVPLTLQAHGTVNFMLGSAARHPYPLVTGYYSVHTNDSALRAGEEGIQIIGQKLKADGRI